jgi:hypothetical protein
VASTPCRASTRSKTITFETYIHWSDDVAAAFSAALSERASAGVRIIDAVGSGKMDANQLRAVREAGVEFEKYRPLTGSAIGSRVWSTPSSRVLTNAGFSPRITPARL